MKKINRFLALTVFTIFTFQLLTTHCIAQYTKLLDLSGTSNGSFPYGSLISDGTFLYGMTYYGGTNNIGVIFKIKSDGTGYSKLYDFGANGGKPSGDLISEGTYLYGMTRYGGTSNLGVIFKIKPDGTGYSKLLDFTGSNGRYPNSSLISDGTFLYGMTYEGGPDNDGVIFKIKLDGTGYAKLHDFSSTTSGSNPSGSLFTDGTFLYGMTEHGGASGKGVIFKIKPDGSAYSKLLDFSSGGSGNSPTGSFISDGTFLYGMAAEGGSNSRGTLFKIKHDGTGFSKLLDFGPLLGSNGNSPYGSVIFDGTFLYGMTRYGGTGPCSTTCGIVFKIKPDGTGYSKLLDFAGTSNGSNPVGSLFFDGTFLYGMTYQGGTNNMGTIFKYTLTTGILEKNAAKDFNVYPNPSNGTFIIEISDLQKQLQHNISITNFLGDKVFQSEIKNQQAEIDLSKQPNGIYFINLKTEKGTAVQKLIIQK